MRANVWRWALGKRSTVKLVLCILDNTVFCSFFQTICGVVKNLGSFKSTPKLSKFFSKFFHLQKKNGTFCCRTFEFLKMHCQWCLSHLNALRLYSRDSLLHTLQSEKEDGKLNVSKLQISLSLYSVIRSNSQTFCQIKLNFIIFRQIVRFNPTNCLFVYIWYLSTCVLTE